MPAPSSNLYLTDAVKSTTEMVRGLVVVAVEADAGSTAALRWAFDEAVMRGTELEVILGINPDAPYTEMSGWQRDVSEMLADWRSDFPGLAVRIDVTRGDPTRLLIEASSDGVVVVIGYPHTAGLLWSTFSHDPRLSEIGAGPVVLVRTAGDSHDRRSDKVLLAV